MAVTLNTTTYKIQSQSKSPENTYKKAQFGDGYAKYELHGINYDNESFNITFIPMDSTSSLALETLLNNSVNGVSNVLAFTPHGESTQKYYIAMNIQKDAVPPNRYQISCTLERFFGVIS